MFLIQLDLNYSFLLFQLLNFSKAVKIRKKNYIGTFLIPGPRQIHIHTHTHIQTKQSIPFIMRKGAAQNAEGSQIQGRKRHNF